MAWKLRWSNIKLSFFFQLSPNDKIFWKQQNISTCFSWYLDIFLEFVVYFLRKKYIRGESERRVLVHERLK